MAGVVHWVVALPSEARPLIEKFSLMRIHCECSLFPIFQSKDGCDRLVVSGIGKTSAAAAAALLAERSAGKETGSGGWINFGIAGSGLPDFGQAFLASRVTDRGSGRSWYPPAVWPRCVDLPRREVVTVDRPEVDGVEGNSLIEMEAAGFQAMATRVATSELCQVVKVVSDDPDHSVVELRKEEVESLCRSALVQIDPWLAAFRDLVEDREKRDLSPPGFEEWQECARFSVTQVHQLRRLLQQWSALAGRDGPPPPAPGRGEASPRECLARLRGALRDSRSGEFETRE